MDVLREKLAALCHDQWGGWMEYLFDDARGSESQHKEAEAWTIHAESYRRWRRQMRTSYADLPENEKESDRKEADRFLAMLKGAGVL